MPTATCWGGVVSLMRVYSPRELQAFTAATRTDGHAWEIGRGCTGIPLFGFIYLLGYRVCLAAPVV